MLTGPGRTAYPGRQPDTGAPVAELDLLLRVAVDHIRHGLILVNRSCHLVFANREARTILGAGDGLHERPCGLHAETVEMTRLLRRVVETAAVGSAAPAVIALPRRARPHPLSLEVRPLHDGTALVLIVDPDRATMLGPEPLRLLYGLTDAESAVAVAVARGEGLSVVAAQLEIGLSTARTHLQRVFQKTRTRRQAQLVRLLVAGCG